VKSLYPLLFEPNFREVVWGGGRLLEWKGLPPADVPIGESWEVCSLPERESVISNGPYAGRKLNDFTDEMGEKVLGRAVVKQYGRQLPLLVKLIDAHQDLSIQVHPNDEMAMRYHGKKGKTEMWYVIDAEPGSSVLVGFKKKITPLEYGLRVMDGTICDVLARHEVKPGDVFYIPSGRVHAICGGILLAEVQQSSDITYRIFDYDRPGIDGRPRELHTEMAAKAIDYEVLDDYRTHYLEAIGKAVPVINSPYFSIRVTDIVRPLHRDLRKYDSFVISICLQGSCRIEPRTAVGMAPTAPVTIRSGFSTLIPAAIADYDIMPLTSETRILETFIDNCDDSLAARAARFFHLSIE
jgi:mannose-6-phosphate isomerase